MHLFSTPNLTKSLELWYSVILFLFVRYTNLGLGSIILKSRNNFTVSFEFIFIIFLRHCIADL